MLPSTGYFKGINCPFYDSGLCERPYCHFRHVKKELQGTSNDGIESGAILQKLVSAAVQKVLQQTDTSPSPTLPQSGVVESITEQSKAALVPKATYNPTPIAELNKINVDLETIDDVNDQKKRHIPVPYTPRKPASLPMKRSFDSDNTSKPFVFIPPPLKYTPGSTESIQLDQYTPKGTVESTEKYTPGIEPELPEYSPVENQNSSKLNYIPSDKNVTKKKNILEYKPAKVAPKPDVPSVTYQPTPRSLAPCFSSDEEEPETKKPKLVSDLKDFDDLEPEFDILDQILNEEKPTVDVKKKSLSDDTSKKKSSKKHKENNNEACRKNKKSPTSLDSKKSSREKSKNEKDRSTSREKHKHDNKSSSSSKTSNHKSSSKDKDKKKYKEDKKDKKHPSSRNSDRSSRLSEKHSKSSEKETRKSSSSKSSTSDRKNKEHKSNSSSKKSKEKREKTAQDNNSINGFSDSDNIDISNDNIDFDQNDEETYLSESDEEAIALECKKIFEEYEPTKKTHVYEDFENKVQNDVEEEYVPTKKRISRTLDKNVKILPKPPAKPDFKLNAAQAMAERLGKIKEYHAAKNNLQLPSNEQSIPKVDFARNSSNTSTKIRIAHVPYASTMMNAKKVLPPSQTVAKQQPSTSSTIVQTVKKGVQRVAHMPNEKFIDRPGVLEPLASKIPANIRSTYLNMMIDQCLNIYLSAVDAYARAQHEELATSKKCSTVQIYKNSAVLTISRLKKELQECKGVKKSGTDCNTLQKLPQGISGQSGNAGSWSIENKYKKIIDSKEFNGAKLYNNVKKWVLTEEQLQSNGFPRLHPNGKKGAAIIYAQNKQKPPVGNIRMCCRCKKEFMIDKKGFAVVKEECIYHPNNKYRVRGEARYQCCSQDGMADGCCVAPSHVYEYLDYDNLKGYVRTLPPETKSDDYGVYSLDCEMCYTTHGLDLTRVTVINSACKVVYETLVKPLHPIIDYNTRYSGITEEHMAEVKTTLLEVQATLLTMFNSKTILIGHSLESDFKALKLIHDTVIDTSVLFPHKMGPPYKRALRNLSSEHLKKIIQNSVDGHDSAEDAMVCMELIHYKLKEDLKTR
ncbi:RNA exonuclease 1 homolog [Cydia pomonella]|uniref:RNA exonuclease 1 homolog n=1 Tax=Cydia pomonella TaxID=82600 RepID=UPI002ADDB0E0|nr:RNA exonuclease 1 homolog [Cydia pomonella]